MNRTWGAVALAAFISFAAVAGLGVFLGFDGVGSVVAGVVVAVLAGLLLWAAARRAETFHDQDIPPVEPGFPGPPDREDGDEDASRDEATDDRDDPDQGR